ncbi:MAG: secondary thiamine-phosphate synthase enzyme YjbQ [Candidatus Omnitrophica bacterium]|nr:secondary thiamine-phosphate synthase enzyme YjbQ [Candidatus Omnitrophota bacterium]
MKIITKEILEDTKGAGDLVDITEKVTALVEKSGTRDGNVTVFVVGSTAALTTFEYEPGLIKDVRELCEKLIPAGKRYHHDDTWGDANGFSHLRSALFGPSIVVPFRSGKLALGTWQQLVLAEFDNRPRHRQVVVQIMGE